MRNRILLLISIVAFSNISNYSYASTVDAIVLTDVEITQPEIETGEAAELILYFQIPSYFDWDPSVRSTGGYVSAVYCPADNLSGSSCSFPKPLSNFRIEQIQNFDSINQTGYKEVTLRIFGIIDSGAIGEFVLYTVRVTGADLPERNEVHVYTRNKTYAEEATIPRTDIAVPNFSNGDIKIPAVQIEEPVVPETSPEVDEEIIEEEPEVSVEVDESVPEQVPTSTPQPSSGSSGNQSVTAIVTPAIQSNFMLPAIKGDQNWRPLKGIKGNFENWKVANKNSLEGVPVRFTKTNGSMITFTTVGEAVSVRYLAGKKRGSFSIYVNGKFLERIDTSKKKKQSLVKTWNNLGEGKHYIDIVAELDNGQSLAISGVQKLKD